MALSIASNLTHRKSKDVRLSPCKYSSPSSPARGGSDEPPELPLTDRRARGQRSPGPQPRIRVGMAQTVCFGCTVAITFWFLSFVNYVVLPRLGALQEANVLAVAQDPSASTSILGFLNQFNPKQPAPLSENAFPIFVREAETGKIFFVTSLMEKYHVASCNPCDNEYTVCAGDDIPKKYMIPVVESTKLPFSWETVQSDFANRAKFVCPMHPVGVDGPTLRYMKDSVRDSNRVTSEGFEGFVKDLVHQPGYFFYVEKGVKHHINSCMPCGRKYTLCPSHDDLEDANIANVITATLVYEHDTRFGEMPQGPGFICRQYPKIFEGYSAWRRKPLNINVDEKEPKRLNIVMTGIGRDLTGGPLSIMRFASAMLDHQKDLETQGFGVRWINVDGGGINRDELAEHLKKYGALTSFREGLDFVMDALNPRTPAITVNPDDLFMSTLYYTAFICHETTKDPRLNNKNFLYFIQDFEPIFFPQDSNYLEAMESYRYPHFAIYSTFFLHDWFRERGHGQYAFLSQGAADAVAFASYPAIKPWGKFVTSVFDDPKRTRKIIVYARSHADRNAYQLTIDTLSNAVCEGVITSQWEVIGVGAIEDYVEHLGQQCGKLLVMKIFANIPENEYRKIVRSGDVGFSLMISPHPSLPPFDFVSAGLVTVTNSLETKTKASFERVSNLFVVSEPYPVDLVLALKEAVKRSEDIVFRKTESENMHWEKEWHGDRCYGPPLFKLMERWFRTQQPLWDPNKIAHSKQTGKRAITPDDASPF